MRVRGQVTVEYVVVFAILMLVFVVAFHSVSVERKHASQMLWSVDARENTWDLAESINAAVIGGPGTNMTITMPGKLVGGVNYTITVYPRMVALDIPSYNREFTWRILTSNINGSDAALTLHKGEVTIMNKDDVIYLS
ncbi:MAG: hypothetical protein GF416_05260 [Candidatus Altiarchaeales archaeon]|nr:hypothetical protein [Candidatus Altiarchaeales archaeon]MBD3416525.1 hypothetical protein [Candidatus Altiarchaeales archaeon]